MVPATRKRPGTWPTRTERDDMAEDTNHHSDLAELLGPQIETTPAQAVRDALDAHEGLDVVIEVECPDGSTMLHTSGVLRKALGSAGDYFVGGEQNSSGYVRGFRAAL